MQFMYLRLNNLYSGKCSDMSREAEIFAHLENYDRQTKRRAGGLIGKFHLHIYIFLCTYFSNIVPI